MVPNNIVWAFYSASDYQNQYDSAMMLGKSAPKDVYYKNTKGEWVKVTAVFSCIDEARRQYRLPDAKYLGPVYEDTKGEIERGAHYPPSPLDKKSYEEQRKAAIRKRLGVKKSKLSGSPGTIAVKAKPSGNYDNRIFDDYFVKYKPYNWEEL